MTATRMRSATPRDTTGDSSDTTDTTGTPSEGSYGSDPELDELYDSCEDGDYAACDQLYLDSPSGSEYEDFGDSCGDRNEPSGFCVDLYGEGEGGIRGDGRHRWGRRTRDFEDTMAETYQSMLGLNEEQADCLAGKIAEVIEDGEHRRGAGHDRGHGLPLRLRHQPRRHRRQLADPVHSGGASR